MRLIGLITDENSVCLLTAAVQLDLSDAIEHEVGKRAVVIARHNEGVSMTVHTLSLSGARLDGPLSVTPEDRVQLLLEVAGQPHEIEAEVIQVQRDSFFMDRVTVRFVEIGEITREAIRDALDRHPALGID